MPTKKKRVGFIPREDVMTIIEKLSIENNLSHSKIISILVEEALTARGIFNKKTGKITQLYQATKKDQDLFDYSFDFKDNDKVKNNMTLGDYKNSNKTNPIKIINQEDFDLNTYKKFLSFLKFQEMIEKFNG